MIAVLRLAGTIPVWRERLIILVIKEQMEWRWVFIRGEGNGSREHVDDLDLQIISSTSCRPEGAK